MTTSDLDTTTLADRHEDDTTDTDTGFTTAVRRGMGRPLMGRVATQRPPALLGCHRYLPYA